MIKFFPDIKHFSELSSEEHWDYHYLGMAEHISKKSKDPSSKVGSVIVDNEHRTISTGYNGLPKGVDDIPEILENRDRKYAQIIHAEENAILFARQSLKNYMIYVWPMMSCCSCCSKIIQSGIKKVVTVTNDVLRWKESFDISRTTFDLCNVEVIEYDLDSYKNLKQIEYKGE